MTSDAEHVAEGRSAAAQDGGGRVGERSAGAAPGGRWRRRAGQAQPGAGAVGRHVEGAAARRMDGGVVSVWGTGVGNGEGGVLGGPLPVMVSVSCRSYAPWCPACQSLQPEWEKFAEWGEDLDVNIAKVDVTEQPGGAGKLRGGGGGHGGAALGN